MKIMEEFMNVEMADMHIVYCEVHCDGRAASRLHAEWYPNRVYLTVYCLRASIVNFVNIEHSAETDMMLVAPKRHIHQL